MTSARGTVTSCGPGQDFSLQYTCAGPSCADLNGFPNTNCTTDGTTLTCTNGVTCPGPTNYTSNFSFTQSNIIVSQTQNITLKDFCEEIDLTSDGTTGGTNTTMVDTGPCGPGSSNSTNSTTSSSTASTMASTSPLFPSTASHNGTYTPPQQTSTTTNTTTSLWSVSGNPGVIPSSARSSLLVSGSIGVPPTSWSTAGALLATSSSAWLPWVTVDGSGSSFVAPGPDSTGWTTTTPATGLESGTKTSETFHKSTGPTSQSTTHTDSGLWAQATYPPSGTSPRAGSSKGSSDGLTIAGSSQSSDTGGATLAAATQDAWSAEYSGAPTSDTTNPSSTGTPIFGSNGMTTFHPSTGSNTAPPFAKFTNNAGSVRHHNAPALWCVLLLFYGLLVQCTHASTYASNEATADLTAIERDVSENDALVNYTQDGLAKRALKPGWKALADDFSEYLAGKLSTPEFADNLVAEVAKAVCDHAAGQLITKALGVDLVEACVSAIYAGNSLVAPELEFLSVFGAGIVCNLMVSEALPGIDALTSAICDEPKPCSEDLLTDPKNCGSCGNVCPTGACANGACTSNSCTGQTCSTFGPCGPGGSCVCASTTEGTGYCVDGSTPCAGLADCASSTNCASGEICAYSTCCGRNVCVGATFCGGGSSANATSKAKLLRRTWENTTISNMGSWVEPVRL